MKESIKNTLIIWFSLLATLIFVVALLAIIYHTFIGWYECDGYYVRGLFWYTCIGEL